MQQQKVHMDKRKFRIGDLAEELKVKKFVIRFWEKEFDIKSDRSEGGQRFYTSEDLHRFIRIKDLLYNKGFTIAGAKKQLYADLENMMNVSSAANTTTSVVESVVAQPVDAPVVHEEQKPTSTMVTPALYQQYPTDEFSQQLAELKEQLVQLKSKLKTS
jgi:DNA-binding transcriptional MerR regulator